MPLAWAIKSAHFITAIFLLLNRGIIISSVVNMIIFIMGIIMVHYSEGWFVVGGGRNGVEFNILLISVLIYLICFNKKV